MFFIFRSAPWVRSSSAVDLCLFSQACASAVFSYYYKNQECDDRRYFMMKQKEKNNRILTMPCIFGSAPWDIWGIAQYMVQHKLYS